MKAGPLRAALLIIGAAILMPASAVAKAPNSGSWSKAADMLAEHVAHTATLLPDGRVLVAGGTDLAGNATAECELYDPRTNQWTRAADMNFARADHTATLLANGNVLVVGGDTAPSAFPDQTLAGAEIYEPRSNRWTTVRSPRVARARHSAARLKDGRVLIAGGRFFPAPGAPLDVPEADWAEIYDAGTPGDPWSEAGTGLEETDGQAFTLLPDGSVLATGGHLSSGSATTSAELFNPALDRWLPTTWPMADARYEHTATLLRDGKVLLVGGYASAGSSTGSRGEVVLSSEVFDLRGNTGIRVAFNKIPRIEHTATLLGNGMVLIVGSAYTSSADSVLFDPNNTETLLSTGMTMDRYLHTATLLQDGRVLIAGGYGVGSQRTVWIYSPISAPAGPTSADRALQLGAVVLLVALIALGFAAGSRRLRLPRRPSPDDAEWVEP